MDFVEFHGFFLFFFSLSFMLIGICFNGAEGEAVVGGGKQAKGGAANRRALGDIGNLVTVRGIDAKVNRPITRSFCAQLLANAQAAAKAENNKVSSLLQIIHQILFSVLVG